MLFQELQQYLLAYSLFIPRLLGCFTTLPILSKKLLATVLNVKIMEKRDGTTHSILRSF